MGANIEARNKCGLTPLISAALTERPEFVQLLVDRGVDVNVEGGIGRPALYFAIEKLDETGKYDGHGYRIAEILLKNGADVEGGEPLVIYPADVSRYQWETGYCRLAFKTWRQGQ